MTKPSNYWKGRLSKKDSVLNNKKKKRGAILQRFRINGLTKGIDIAYQWYSQAPHGIDLPATKKAYKILFPKGISDKLIKIAADSSLGSPTLHKIQGVLVTAASLKYAYIVGVLFEYLKSDTVVWEIGSGYGGQARALLLTGKIAKYFSQDFSPHMKIQNYFLKEFNEKVINIDPNTPPPEKVDLIICSHAMMEMNSDEVAHYLALIYDYLKPGGYFYFLDDPAKAVVRNHEYCIDETYLKLIFSKDFPDYQLGKVGIHQLYQRR